MSTSRRTYIEVKHVNLLQENMINQNKLLQALNLREDDSKRIDAILDSLIWGCMDSLDFKEYIMYYNAEFKVFEVRQGNANESEQVFKDGREAIDYCFLNKEIEPDFANFSDESEKLANKTVEFEHSQLDEVKPEVLEPKSEKDN